MCLVKLRYFVCLIDFNDLLTRFFSIYPQEIDIKNQNISPYAFIRFAEISSVLKAIKKYRENPTKRLKLGYAKSFETTCIFISDYKQHFDDEKSLEKYLSRYGLKSLKPDYQNKNILCALKNYDMAKKAIEELNDKRVNGKKLRVEFASRDYQQYFEKRKINNRESSGSWISANSKDNEDRIMDRNRSTSSYHHHQFSSKTSSLSCTSRSNSYTRSPSLPPSPPDNTFNSRHISISQSSLHSGNNRKYDFQHDSSSSCRSRYRYGSSDVDDIEDVESHSSSISKREMRYRSHLSENFISDASPKIRRDSSPYSSYSNSSIKLETDYHRLSSVASDEYKSHDGHSVLRRTNHSKMFYKSGRDSPTSHVSQFRNSVLSNSSSSSSSSSNSRSPICDVKSSSHYPDRTSVSPPTSPRSNAYSYHESDGQTHSTTSDANVDHSLWRRKSTEENSCHRDYLNSDIQRFNSDSISNSNDSNFSVLNSYREHGRDYFRDRVRESHHRTNSFSTLPYQNRFDSIKRKFSSLEMDENSSDLSGHLERKKRLLACIEQPTNPTSANSQSSSATSTSLTNKNSNDQRITSSKSLDFMTESKSQKVRDSNNELWVKRRLSSSSNSATSNMNSFHNSKNNDTGVGGNSGTNISLPNSDLNTHVHNSLSDGWLNESHTNSSNSVLNPDKSGKNIGGQTSSSALKPKTKELSHTIRTVDCKNDTVNNLIPDPRSPRGKYQLND